MLGRAIRADETVRGAPRLAVIGLDARVLLFTLVVSVSTGLLFGLLPAIGASGVSLVDALKGAGRGTGSAGGRGRIRSGLVIGELALALRLRSGPGLVATAVVRPAPAWVYTKRSRASVKCSPHGFGQ